MKAKIITLLVILGIISSLITACNLVVDSPMKQIMKLTPVDASQFIYINLETLRTDPELRDFYDDEFGDDFEDFLFEQMGIYASEIDTIAMASSEDYDEWGFIEGEFDIEDFRYAMEDNEYEEGEYRSVETWSDGYDYYAVLDNMIMFGEEEDNIRTSIRLSEGSGTSMYDNEDYMDVVNRLPAGIIVILTQDEDEEYLVIGITFSKISSSEDILEIKVCAKYRSERRAENNLRAIEEEFEYEYDSYITDIRQDGVFIEVTGEIDLADLYIPF